MFAKVKLSYIAGELDLVSEEWSSYLNKETGKVVHLSPEAKSHVEMEDEEDEIDDEEEEESYADSDEYAEARAVYSDEQGVYVALPSKFDIHEYSIMQKFCYSVRNEQIRDTLCSAIRGSGAFRRFKDEIHRYGIEEDWYKYEERAMLEIARDWCEANGIEYIDDRPAAAESEDEQLSEKERSYRLLAKSVAALLEGERDFLANMANVSALLFQELPDVNWAGFYLLKGQYLVLGPFQGKVACTRIGPGKGVCGAAAQKRESVVVENVKKFPGHIACDKASKSEIVVPLIKAERLIGVLDLDSAMLARFDDDDRAGLEEIARLLLDASDES